MFPEAKFSGWMQLQFLKLGPYIKHHPSSVTGKISLQSPATPSLESTIITTFGWHIEQCVVSELHPRKYNIITCWKLHSIYSGRQRCKRDIFQTKAAFEISPFLSSFESNTRSFFRFFIPIRNLNIICLGNFNTSLRVVPILANKINVHFKCVASPNRTLFSSYVQHSRQH